MLTYNRGSFGWVDDLTSAFWLNVAPQSDALVEKKKETFFSSRTCAAAAAAFAFAWSTNKHFFQLLREVVNLNQSNKMRRRNRSEISGTVLYVLLLSHSLSLIHSHTRTHYHTHIYIQTPTHLHLYAITRTHTHTHILKHTHVQNRANILSFYLWHTLTLAFVHTSAHTSLSLSL